MRKIILFVCSIVLALSASAQSPEAIRESLQQNPNFALATYVTYPPIPIEEIAPAPKGFEPFYFSLAGRHGSRYEVYSNRFTRVVEIFKKADKLSILTDTGKQLLSRLETIATAQEGHKGELYNLGYQQWLAIANRAFDNFAPIFEKGSIDAMASHSLRCVFSMAAFNQGLKERNPHLVINQDAQQIDLPIVRPLYENPLMNNTIKQAIKDYEANGAWVEARDNWSNSRDVSSFLSKVTTDIDRLVKECGGKSQFRIARYAYVALISAENFGVGDRTLVNELFNLDELYSFYVYYTNSWVNGSVGRGNEMVELKASFVGTMVDDILEKAKAAIEGKNPNCADLRFSHDSHIAPLMSAMGYNGCSPIYSEDPEKASTSFNQALVTPMASNLQIILYRNKSGKVYVRSLINERDAYLPIKCKSAPFYPWNDFLKHVERNMASLYATRDRVLKERGIAIK